MIALKLNKFLPLVQFLKNGTPRFLSGYRLPLHIYRKRLTDTLNQILSTVWIVYKIKL